MFECLQELKNFAESLCLNDSEKQELANTWGVQNIFDMAQKQIDTQYKFYNIFEPVYFKMLANYYAASLMGITFNRFPAKDWKKGDKEAKNVEAIFDKWVKSYKVKNTK